MKKLKSLKYILAIMTALLASATMVVWGVDYTWDGGAGTIYWSDANNWNPNGIPGTLPADTVTFTNTATPATVRLSADVSMTSLTFDTSNAVTFELNGNDLTLSGTLNIGSSVAAHPGVNVTINGNGTIDCDTFDTNEDATNTLILNTSVIIVVTTTLYLDQNIGTTTFTGDGTCVFAVPGGSANPEFAEPSFTINSLPVATTGTNIWLGGTFDWGTATNWSDGIPAPGDDVLIPQGPVGFLYPILNAVGDAANVTIDTGAELTINGTLTVTNTLTNNGSVTIASATSTISAFSIVNGGSSEVVYDNNPCPAAWGSIYNNLTVTAGARVTLGTVDITLINGTLTNNGIIEIDDSGSIYRSNPPMGTYRYSYAIGGDLPTLNGYSALQITGGTWDATAAGATLSAVSLSVSAGATLNLDTNGVELSVTGATTNDGTITGDGTEPMTFGGNYTGNAASATLTTSGTDTYFRGTATDLRGTLIPNAGTVTFDNNAVQTMTPPTAGSFNILTINKTGGSFTANPGTLVCTTFNNAGGGFPITFNGNTDITNITTFGTTGLVTFGNDNLDSTTFQGGVTHTAGNSALSGQLIANDAPITLTGGTLRTLTLGDNASITTDSSTGANITLGTVSNGTSYTLGLTADGGDISVNGAVGGGTALGALTVNSANAVRFYSTVNAASLTQMAGTATRFDNNITTTGTAGINVTATNITLDGLTMTAGTAATALIALHGNVALTTGLASLYASQTIHAYGTVSGAQALTVETTNAAGSAITFDLAVGNPTPLGAITVTNGRDVTFSSTVSSASLTQSAGAGTTTFIDNVTTTSATGINVTATNINLDGLTMTAGTAATALIALHGNVALTTGLASLYASQTIHAYGTVSGAQALTVETTNAAGSAITFDLAVGNPTPLGAITVTNGRDVTFSSTVSSASLTQSAGAGTTTFIDNVTTTSATGINVTATNINLDGLTMTAGTDPAASINLHGPATLTTGPVNLYSQQTIHAYSSVSGAQNLTVGPEVVPGNTIIFDGVVGTLLNPIGTGTGNAITINGDATGTCTFNDTVQTQSGISQSADSTIVFTNNITQTGAASTDAVFNGNVTFTNTAALTYQSVRSITFGNDATLDDVTINGAASVTIQTTLAANGNIIFNAPVTAVNAANSLIITNAGRFQTNEDADINLTAGAGANFTQNGGGLNQLAGGITTAGGGTISFLRDVYLFGTGPVEDMTFNSAATPITFAADLHIAAVLGKIINLASPITAQNIVLYAGEINLTGASITTTEDLVLFGSGYSIADADTGIATLFSYAAGGTPSRTGTKAPNATIRTAATFPDGLTAFPAPPPAIPGYSGSFNLTNLSGKTIIVGDNFYANGISLAATGVSWTLSIPDNSNATTHFAEAYGVTVGNCAASPGYVSAVENCNELPASSTSGWDFTRPTIVPTGVLPIGTYTVYDNVIRIQFSEAIENTNDEINTAVSSIYYYDGDAGTQRAFTGAFTDPRCLPADSTNNVDDITTFYLQTVQTLPPGIQSRWNTDATGLSAGATDSTDRGRSLPSAVAPAHRTSIPYINLPKALAGVYQTLRDSHKNRVGHYYEATPTLTLHSTPGNTYTAVTDQCRPVLAAVYTGQEAHLLPDVDINQVPYDAHNFIEFRWSEEVTIAGVPDNALNSQTTVAIGGITSWGAGLEIAGFGRIQTGRLSTFERAYGANIVILNTLTVHALYRNFSIDGVMPPPLPALGQTHRIRLSIAGLSEKQGTFNYWPSYIDHTIPPISPTGLVTDPPLATAILIEDATGNDLERIDDGDYNKATISVSNTPAGLYSPWDLTPPCLAVKRSTSDLWNAPIDATTQYEAVPAASAGIISRLELHFLDNAPTYTGADLYCWWSKVGWCLPGPTHTPLGTGTATPLESFGGSRPVGGAGVMTSGGIRESTLYNAEDAFTVNNTGSVIGSTIPGTFGTNADTPFMNPSGATNVSGDPYIRLILATTWPINGSSLTISYNAANGYITDLAGNLMPSFSNLHCLDRTPLQMAFSLAGVGRQDLFVLFSKDLDLSATLPVIQNGLAVSLSGTPVGVDGLSLVRGNPRALLFHLNTPVTAEDLMSPTSSLTILQNGTTTYFDPDTMVSTPAPYFVDTDGNYALVGAIHELTNIGIGLVNILYGADNVNKAGLLSATEGALRANGFDGTGRLLDSDITLATQLSLTTAPEALALYFDVKPPTTMMPESYNTALDASNTLWLPSVITGFNVLGNSDARALSPTVITDANRLFRNFLIPESDPEIVPGSKVELVMQYGGLYCARLRDNSDITSIAPWSFVIAETRRQRGGVTILNNVINVNNREKVIVQVDVPSSGNIVIQVFTLDGNVVKILDRGRRGGGTYQYFWDGTNGAGNPVARGLYFIRVVGPDIDEIRKVMVVKD